MRSKDVKHWAVHSSVPSSLADPYADDDDMAPGAATRAAAAHDDAEAPSPAHDWDAFVAGAARRVASTSTKERLVFLQQRLLPLAKDAESGLEAAQRTELVALLVPMYARYVDRASQLAAQAALEALLRAPSATESSGGAPPFLKYAVGYLRRDAERLCKAGAAGVASTRINLLSWLCCTFAALCAESEPSKSVCWEPLVGSIALAYDSLMGSELRPALKRSVLRSTRRTVRQNHTQIPALVETLTATAAGPAALRAVTLLGLIVDVSLRLRIGGEAAKGEAGGTGRSYVSTAKPAILSFFTSHVVSSKTAVPEHVHAALHDFVAAEVTEEDMTQTLRPAMEKMLLRSPELALPVASSCFAAYAGNVGPHLKALQNAIMSASRSSAAATRTRAVALFGTLVARSSAADVRGGIDEFLAVLKSGKASSPDHRAALFQMLHVVPASAELSPAISEVVAGTLAKEAQEAAMQAAMSTLSAHLGYCLRSNIAVPASVAPALCKELQNAKIPLRKAVSAGVGSLLWELPADGSASAAAKAFGDALLPGLEANIKAATTNTLTSPAGPLEGYVAVAVIEGRLAQWGGAAKIRSDNAVLQSIAAGGIKPSFVLWDKVYRRATSDAEELWFVRALESVLTGHASTLKSEPSGRVAAAMALMHAVFGSTHNSTSRAAVKSTQVLARSDAELAAALVQHGVNDWLQKRAQQQAVAKSAKDAAEEDAASKTRDVSRPLRALLQAAASSSEATEESVRQSVLVGLLVVAHHAALEDRDRAFFIDLVQRSRLDPRVLVEQRLAELLATARDAVELPYLRDAAFAAYSTLVLVAPDMAISQLVLDIQNNVQLVELAALTSDDLGMWRTEEGTLFIDILSAKKEKTAEKRNHKDAKIEAWEAELRESIARKKAAENKTYTRDEKAAIDAQLNVEAAARARVAALELRLTRALRTISSIVAAHVEEIDSAMSTLTRLVLSVLGISQALTLSRDEALRAFSALSSCISPRLADYEVSMRSALLRSVDEQLVSEDLRRESFGELVARVLYRLRFVAEQGPLDLTTVSFVAPLLTSVITQGGLGVPEDDSESAAEQVQLALDFIAYHAGACSDVRFPRLEFIDDLAHVVAKHGQLAKDAVSAMRSMGEAMKTSATGDEISNILRHALADEVSVRSGSLQALLPLDLTNIEFCVELWLACHDEDEENARLAEKAWEENGLDVPEVFAPALVPLLEHTHVFVRLSTGRALAEAARMHPEAVTDVIAALRHLYELRAVELKPELDKYGLVIDSTVGREDPWRTRVAIALAFQHLAPLFNGSDVEPFFEFLIQGEALGDRSEEVRQKMLDAGSAVIDALGAERLAELIHMFESYLAHPTPSTESNDGVTEAVVILFGRLARHLDSKDPRVGQVVERLISALATPSELVQVAVTDCLPPLVRSLGPNVRPLVDRLFSNLLAGPKYALRRGSAYGLAGVVKGRGISAIAEFRIMQRLADAIEDKKSSQARQGAMMAYETLSATLGRLFEPYVPGILPHMLVGFADGTPDVREATQDTARVLMSNVTGYCTKIILPTLLEGLEDKQWRTKKGAIELLGAMAYCAPRQLSAALPTIIPNLNEPLKDSHTQVRQAAERALAGFGGVISNPEIKKLVPVLLKALIDPTAKTQAALTRILRTSFSHVLDGPSLALVVPILERGLRERSAAISKDASRIVGNLASITDSKDFVPYLKNLVPLVRLVLVSPVPEARAVAAKALGTLVERLGEVNFVELVPSLLQVLRSDATGVDRQGSAQGLAEVLAALGIERMASLLPEVVGYASSPRAYVRAGALSLLIYLPATFGPTRFAPYMSRIVPPILSGIADPEEPVRDASMRAGRMIINQDASKAVDLLLPHLEQGMFDENWRIRMSSIQLVADLLFKCASISGKNEVEDGEDGEGAAEENTMVGNSIQKQLIEALGQDRRDAVLAGLYILRQDSVVNVRQMAINIWKSLVSNTPKTAREVLPVMLNIIIKSLASEGVEQREMAGRTLGELVAKLGERILGESIPLLRLKGAEATEPLLRAGVCFAVTEILAGATKTQLEDHEDSLIAIVRHGLVDESAKVRHAAAQAFDSMQQVIGSRAIDETIPTLLGALQSQDAGGSSETALAALREVMRARGDVVFPVVVPTLTAQPITAFNARALSALVRAAGTALNRRLSGILTALSKSLDAEQDESVRAELDGAVASILGTVADFDGVHQLMLLLLGWAGSAESPAKRATGCRFFAVFCRVMNADVDMGDYYVDWVRRLISLFEDRTPAVVDEAWAALDACLKTVPKGEIENLVVPMRRTVESTGAPGEDLPGFCRPKGAAPLVPVFLAGLLNGTAEQREQGALGLADIVERTSADAIKPLVVSMVGPLIRACGDRHPAAVKAAILSALTTMLQRVPQHTKPFLPQLQRSFQKAVTDPTSPNVRNRAGIALGVLMSLQAARVDAVVLELVGHARPGAGGPLPAAGAASTAAPVPGAADAKTIADSCMQALVRVLDSAKTIGAPAREAIDALLRETFEAGGFPHESFKVAAADVLALLLASHDEEAATALVQEHVLPQTDPQLAALAVAAMAQRAPQQLYDVGVQTKLARAVGNWAAADPQVARPAREAREAMRKHEPWCSDSAVLDVL